MKQWWEYKPSFVLPSELCYAEWQHIDLNAKEWRHLVSNPHIVHLSNQAVEILSRLKTVTGNSRFVFSSEFTDKEQPISKEALLA
ncbi:MAG: hypothetical protein QX189_15645 [Methylococcales bacterium]